MLKGFKDFLLRGNVVDLAVAVVIGVAFAAVVAAFTAAFLTPLIAMVTGGGGVGGTFTINGESFDYGSFISALIAFILTAAVIYLVVVVPIRRIQERRQRGEEAGQAAPTDVELLAEIRDLLAAQQRVAPQASEKTI
ncbi:MAG: large conductance mechanosensitive channel protein MscL [Geodermatophilaceae bacterium]|jgi:large conductance mechanosensitive channel|nr:large conductance mechanosensitive channel protein MscL [Geodermatophilaceae bacterium]